MCILKSQQPSPMCLVPMTALAPYLPQDPAPLIPAELYDAACRPASIYLDERLGPGSRRTMEGALNVIAGLLTNGQATARTCPWAALRYEWTAKLPQRLASMEYKRTTIAKQLAALRGVLKEAWRLGLMDADTYQRASDIQPPRGESLAPGTGRAITRAELAALFAVGRADTAPRGRRDAAFIAVLYGAGLRRAEAVSLRLSDVDLAGGALTVRGKGGKTRRVYLASGAFRFQYGRFLNERRCSN